MEILSWHFWSHRASDRCLNFFSGQGALVVRIILLQTVNHSLRISQAAHTRGLWNPGKFGSFRSQGVITVWPGAKAINLVVVIWLAWTCSRYFVNSSCAVQLAKLCKAERESVKQQEHQAFSRHNVQLTGMKHHETWNFTKKNQNWTIPEPTVRLSWMKRWNVAWSMYFGRPRSAKCLQTWLRKLKTQRDSSTTDQTWPNCPGRCDFLKTQKPYLRPKILILRGVHPQDPHGLPEAFRRKSSNSIAEVREDQVDGTHDFVVELAVDLGEVGVPPLRVHLGQPWKDTQGGTTDRPYRNSGNHERWAWNMVLCSQILWGIWVLLTLLRAVWEPRSQAS